MERGGTAGRRRGRAKARPAAPERALQRPRKTAPPRSAPKLVRRHALEDRLDEGLDRQLTLVVAGPGFGKTTLLTAWAARHPFVRWYTVGREDRALATLARGLADTFEVDLPASVFGALPAQGGDERTRAESVAGLLAEALEARSEAKVALVLDDVQELTRGGPATRLVEALVREAPAKLHVTLSSRSSAPFPIERLRGRGHVMQLDPAVLAFSIAEIEGLLEGALGLPHPALARRVYEVSSGWPAAVRLAVEALRAAPPTEREAVLDRLSLPGGSLFAYLAEEVFGKEPPAVRELLRRVALFDRFTPDLCVAIGLKGAAKTLRGLRARGLFVYPDAGAPGWFALHDLVRDFARKNWPLPTSELKRAHRKAAAWFEAHGELEHALCSLELAEDDRRLARLLSERGPELLASGHGSAALRAGLGLPMDLRDSRLDELLGDAHRIAGDRDAALRQYLLAAGETEALPPRLAWRIGLVHYPSGDLAEAVRSYARADVGASPTRDEAILFGYWACAEVKRGELASARALAARALEAAHGCGDDVALAHGHTALAASANASGDLETGESHYRRALEAADRANDVGEMMRSRINLADVLTEHGAFDEALDQLNTAIQLAELTGYHAVLPLGLSNRGEAYLGLGRLEEAIADLERVRTVRQKTGPRFAGASLVHLGDAYRLRGDLALARGVYEETVRFGEQSGNLEWLRVGLAGLARLLAREEPERAAELAQRAVAYERGRGEDTVMSLLAKGWVVLVQGDAAEAGSIALEAAATASNRRNRSAIAEALELQALASPAPDERLALLHEAHAVRRAIGDVLGAATAELAIARLSGPAAQASADRARRRLRKLGVRGTAAGAAGLLMALGPERPAAVAIETLGGFHVLREGEPVATSEWQSRKARDLLKILIARRGRPTARDVLMETLWPDGDPRSTANRLSVALSTVRTVLDPERSFDADRFVVSQDNVVSLNLSELSLDVEGFVVAGEAALDAHQGSSTDARDLLEAAEEAYTGDFLEEDLYEEWPVPLREEARALYIAVAKALADVAAAADDHEAAIRYRLRVLERDAYEEDAHLALVSSLAAAGHHGEARRAYRRYTARMEEIGVEPAPLPARQVRAASRQPLSP